MKHHDELPTAFDDYEISGVREFGSGAQRYCEQVPDADAEFWSLYGHIPGQGVECVGNYKSRKATEEMYARITGRSFRDRQITDRIKRFGKVVFLYDTDDDYETNLVDLLADAMHWSRDWSISFDDSLKMAAEHFAAETKKGART